MSQIDHAIDQAIERCCALLEQPKGPAAVLAANLCMRVNAQSDRSLLPQVLSTFFSAVDDATLVATLAWLGRRGRGGDARYRRVAMELALNAELFGQMDYGRIQDLHEIAAGAKVPQVKALFLSAPYDAKGRSAEESGPENPHLEMSLGWRKSAARSRDRDILDRLMRDRNPEIIALLLNNSRITERDVVRIAAQRPANPACLSVIAHHPKWAQRYTIRKALACNPRTPHPIAERLMRTLMRQDLRFITGTSNLPERVRDEARRALETSAQSLSQASTPPKKKPAAIVRGLPAGQLNLER